MPAMVTHGEATIDNSEMARRNHNYDYPDGLDLRPGTPLHDRIATAVLNKALESSRILSRRRTEWTEVDEKLTAFIPADVKERELQEKDSRKPISIVFPYSYAILETLLSYMVAAFFPEPMFRYEGVSPEDMKGAMLMERVINLHCNRHKVGLNLHTMFRDSGAYGFGAVAPNWKTHHGQKVTKQDNGIWDTLGRFIRRGAPEKLIVDTVLFEGNSLDNIDPYKYLPDPSFALHEVQKGEYVGWGDTTNYMALLTEEKTNPEYFNVKYLQGSMQTVSVVFREQTGRTARSGGAFDSSRRQAKEVAHPVDIIHMYMKIIPRDWELGPGEYPEIWIFTLANDSIVIRAQPVEFTHGMFPVCVNAPDFDGYSPVAYSRLEILSGMQTVIDWLFNSHITNVRKAINDVLIVDPYLININDLKDPGPGGLVRLRRPAWGRGTDKAVQQLNINDITRANMQDVALIIQYMQQVGGTDNPLMGSLRRGGPERLSASEFSGTAQGAVSRLERIARVSGMQSMQDIGYFFAHHTQQMMSEETYVKIVGDWVKTYEGIYPNGRAKVTPFDILVDYDLLVRDGSVPGGNYAEIWERLFQTIGSNPLLMQRFDVVRIFKHIATNLGAKNVDQFDMQNATTSVSTSDDENVLREVERGNLVPLENGIGDGY